MNSNFYFKFPGRKYDFAHFSRDFFSSLFLHWKIWTVVAWTQTVMRYRRSTLGPMWITLATAITVGTIGPVYSKLFGTPLGDYFLYLSTSLVMWVYISQTLLESCGIFIAAQSYITNDRQYLCIHFFIMLARSVILLAHNFVVLFFVYFFFSSPINMNTLMFPVGFFLATLNIIWIGLIIALLCVRFRDLPQLVQSLINISFLLTPIIWQVGAIGREAVMLKANFFFHMIEVLREPLLGNQVSMLSWIYLLICAFIGLPLTFFVFAKFQRRIPFWL